MSGPKLNERPFEIEFSNGLRALVTDEECNNLLKDGICIKKVIGHIRTIRFLEFCMALVITVNVLGGIHLSLNVQDSFWWIVLLTLISAVFVTIFSVLVRSYKFMVYEDEIDSTTLQPK